MESANKMELTYTNVNGYLIPNLTYKSGEQMEQLGKYGFLRRDYLKNHRNSTYQVMLLQDTIGEHLLEVDKAAREREEVILKQLEKKKSLCRIKRKIRLSGYDLVTDSPTKRIYEAVKRIPKGHVATYGKIAEMAGDHRMARAWAMHCIRIRIRNIFRASEWSMRKVNWPGHLRLVERMYRQNFFERMELK